MAHSNTCDPAGDLVLKLGSDDEVTLIRVHLKVLSLASPVFAAMLSPRFAEGQALEDIKGLVDSTTTVDLPDDDPLAMSFLCSTLHFTEDAAERRRCSLDVLMRLAVICDKYNMSRALSPWSHIWMETCHQKGQDDHFKTAWISYGLEHHESFWKSTRDIVRNSTLAELNIEHSFLPDNVIGALRIHCKNLLDQVQSNLESFVISLLQCDCHGEELQGYVESCQHLDTLGKYLKCLSRRGLWPISNVDTYSISGVLKELASFPDLEYLEYHEYHEYHEYPEYHSAGRRMIGGRGHSMRQEENLKTQLNKAVDSVDSELRGLCLSCVKYGTSTKKDGNCHAELKCHYLGKTEHETG